MKSPLRLVLLIAAVVGLSAGRSDLPLDLVRRGNDAFARGDFVLAVDCYTRAEDVTTDPGLVAFNKAAALFRMGEYALAEVHYLRAREGAAGERLARVNFDLGNTLVLRAGERDARLLGRAVDAYRACLAEPEAGPELREDARHNLQIAIVFWEKAKAAEKASPSNPDDPGNRPPSAADTDPRQQLANRGSAGIREPGYGDPQAALMGKDGEGQQGSPTNAPSPPGAGNVPLVPDEDRLNPLAPHEVARVLQDVAERVAKERRDHRRQSQPAPPPTTPDW